MSLGTIFVNETKFDIVRIELHEGKIFLVGYAEAPEPRDWDLRGEIRVHGSDGTSIMTLRKPGELYPMCNNIWFTLPLVMDGVDGYPQKMTEPEGAT